MYILAADFQLQLSQTGVLAAVMGNQNSTGVARAYLAEDSGFFYLSGCTSVVSSMIVTAKTPTILFTGSPGRSSHPGGCCSSGVPKPEQAGVPAGLCLLQTC